eukprot:TRINITY_DN6089_c0_g1_i1.p2 TRINITY_DN6089_c0_g1~~TRINITY_DN6089_c0_g1_i1.p2  ORF type:complete len:62 (-),score=9.46 TRINITY_DN6089_c0_g1_i1:189-374(-)
MAYNGNPTIGYVDTQACNVQDVLPIDVVAECDECSVGHLFRNMSVESVASNPAETVTQNPT